MWDDCRLSSLDHLPPRDLMVDTVQIVPVSADNLKTLNVFDGINNASSCLIIPVIGSRRCDIFVYFKSLQSGDVVHTNILTFVAFGHERNDCVTNNLKAVLKRSGVDVNHSVKRVKLKTSDYPPVLRSTCLHTLFTIRFFYKYRISSCQDVYCWIRFCDIEKWVDTFFTVEDNTEIKSGKVRFSLDENIDDDNLFVRKIKKC